MSKLLHRIEKSLYGRIVLQPLFESFHRIGVRGMNYMQSQLISQTGEVGAMEHALKKHRNDEGWILFHVGANEGQFALRKCGKIYIAKLFYTLIMVLHKLKTSIVLLLSSCKI